MPEAFCTGQPWTLSLAQFSVFTDFIPLNSLYSITLTEAHAQSNACIDQNMHKTHKPFSLLSLTSLVVTHSGQDWTLQYVNIFPGVRWQISTAKCRVWLRLQWLQNYGLHWPKEPQTCRWPAPAGIANWKLMQVQDWRNHIYFIKPTDQCSALQRPASTHVRETTSLLHPTSMLTTTQLSPLGQAECHILPD